MRELDDYALVVVDEAHNLRNPNAQRSEAVNALVGGVEPEEGGAADRDAGEQLADRPAHPDLATSCATTPRSPGSGSPRIRGYIKNAQALDPDSLSPEHLFDLMDQVAVRRTRRFVQDATTRGDTIDLPDGQKAVDRLPHPEGRERIDYDLDDAGRGAAARRWCTRWTCPTTPRWCRPYGTGRPTRAG